MCLVIYNRFLIFIFILYFIYLKVVTQYKVIYMACIVTVIIFFFVESGTLSLRHLSIFVFFPVCGTYLFTPWSFHTLWRPFKIYNLQWILQYLKSIKTSFSKVLMASCLQLEHYYICIILFLNVHFWGVFLQYCCLSWTFFDFSY